jgi:hypothetical protein
MKVKDYTLNSLSTALLPMKTNCYFANRQKLDMGDSMEIVTNQVAAELARRYAHADIQDVQQAFQRGTAGDYEENGQPPYLYPNKFIYFIKKHYEQKQTINAPISDEQHHALPYFSSWEERQIFHIVRRYEDTLKGWRVMMGDADTLFSFFKKTGMASDNDYSTDAMIARAKNEISVQPASDQPLVGVAKSIEKRMEDYNEVAKTAKGVFIKDLYREWQRQGMTPQDVADMLRNNVRN